MCACVPVFMHAYVCVPVFMRVYLYLCVCTCIYACVPVFMRVCVYAWAQWTVKRLNGYC